MDRLEAQHRIAALSAELEEHNHRYYVLAAPTISDQEFDFKLKELELGPRASHMITKRQRIVDFSTRKHHPGRHEVEILVNGMTKANAAVELRC